MASDSQKTPTTKRNKRKPITLDTFYKEKAHSTEEKGKEGRQESSPKTAPPSQKENCPQDFLELQSKVMRMEEIWQEKWETDQRKITVSEEESCNWKLRLRNQTK